MTAHMTEPLLQQLLTEISGCHYCAAHLPLGPRPIVRANLAAPVMVIGQAPGTRVHASGLPWDDPSGDRLRQWLGMDRARFYGGDCLSIMPMGFCYPGKGKGGDLPPRPECAPLWHARLRALLPNLKLTLLIGRYAQRYYLDVQQETLEDTVRQWQGHLERGYFPLPHPSPRNTLWLKRRPGFEDEVLPALRRALQQAGLS